MAESTEHIFPPPVQYNLVIKIIYYSETYLGIFYVKKQTNESQIPVSLLRAYYWALETSHYQ